MSVKLETLRNRARAEYAVDEANGEIAFPYSPARATAAIAKRYGLPASRLVGLVAAVYYEENGTRAPLSFGRTGKDGLPTAKAIARAVRKARDERGRLARWEVLAYRLAAGLGTDTVVSVAAVRAYYRNGGGDEAASYTGNGTRAGAPKTREDETAEIDATLA
jgi:hypothetical protein